MRRWERDVGVWDVKNQFHSSRHVSNSLKENDNKKKWICEKCKNFLLLFFSSFLPIVQTDTKIGFKRIDKEIDIFASYSIAIGIEYSSY